MAKWCFVKKKNIVIPAGIVVILIATVFFGRYFLFPMSGHSLVGMWTPIGYERQYIGNMVFPVRDNVHGQPMRTDLLSFEARGRGGVVSAEVPSAHRFRFLWSSPRGTGRSDIIQLTDYPRYDRPPIGNLLLRYAITEENLLILIPVDDNFREVGEEVIFRRAFMRI